VVWVPVPALDPFRTLAPCWGRVEAGTVVRHLLEAALAWGALTAACLGWAVWRLRPDGLRQLSGHGGRRLARSPDRPPVDDDPVRWKTYYIDGLAPLPGLRRVPRWVGVLGAAAVSVGASLLAYQAARPWGFGRSALGPFIVQAGLFLF